MFLKRKQIKTELFSIETKNRRSAFRVTPLAGEPVFITFRNRTMPINNISASGICFSGSEFKMHDRDTVAIQLPGQDKLLMAEVEIVTISDENICRCRFLQAGKDVEESIHAYVLKRQKDEIKNK